MLDLKMRSRIGTTLFYLLWPLVWIYAPLQPRVRVIIRCKNEILVVKNWFGPNSWQLPGGGMKKGESVSVTASREINEELDIDVEVSEISELTKEIVIQHRNGLKFRYQYALLDLDVKPKIILSSEVSAVKWTRIDNSYIPYVVMSSL